MRSYGTFVLIALMSLGIVFLLVRRGRTEHAAPAEMVEVETLDAGLDGSVTDAAIDVAPPPVDKPLRVASLGWELIAPGVALSPAKPDAGSVQSAPPPPGPAIELAPEASLDAIEARLARGGADPQGADIAVLPLPAFIASFDRLRALEPRAFLVVGFSHGREEIHAAPGALGKAPPPADEVKLVALGPGTTTDVSARATGSESATILGLFALDLLGVAPSRIRFLAPSAPEAKASPFAAVLKGAPEDRPRVLSTADASRLVPIVAVASKSVIEGREALVRAWSLAWFRGLARTKTDVPGVARRLAAKDALPFAGGVGGAPEALALVERLGQIEDATLEQQSSLIGPLAKSAVTLESLTQRSWRLARGAGMTTAAAPEPLPIDARIVSMIAPPPQPSAVPRLEADAGAHFATQPVAGAISNIVYRAVEGDADEVAAQVAFLAGVFERGIFKITAKGGDKAAKAIASNIRDRGVASNRLLTGAAEPQRAFALVEVLSPP